MSRFAFPRMSYAALCLFLFQSQLSLSQNLSPNSHPYEAKQSIYHCDLLVVGGSSAGTAAALTAGRMGLNTILVMRSPRELGGLEANGLNPDSDLLIRCVGGFSMEMDVLGRVSTGLQIEHTKYVAPPHTVFRYIQGEFEKLPNITIIADYYPDSVEKEGVYVSSVIFRHRKALNKTITIHPTITIDAEVEGDVSFLAGVSMTLKREGKVPSDDPTRNLESFAGEIYVPAGKGHPGGAPLPQSTFQADDVARTMAWSAILVLEKHDTRSPDNPWLLTLPPAGYDPEDYEWVRGLGGVSLGDNHFRYSSDVWYSLVEGWKMPDGRHVLESMNIADREANERKHFARTLGALYHGQHVAGKTEWGLSSQSFREGLPAKYTLADFGTSTLAGDIPLPSLIYMREGRRMVNAHVFGAKFMENQGTEALFQKNYWHQHSFYFNAMNIDIHGVTNRFVEGSGPEGIQIPRFIDPNFGVCCIPFDVCVPRVSEATGLLVASAGAYTHEAYSAFPRMEPGRFQIGEGCAIAAYISLHDNVPPHEADIEKTQLIGLTQSGHSLVYFDDAIPGTWNHVIDQMLGARGVPLHNAQGEWISETEFSSAQALECLDNIFRKYTDTPVPDGRFENSTKSLHANPDTPAIWGDILPIVSSLSGIGEIHEYDALFARYQGRGFFTMGEAIHESAPIRFSEFKRLLFNILFSQKSPEGPYPIQSSEIVLRDTFNRVDGSAAVPEIGPKYISKVAWSVNGGLAIPENTESDSFLWVSLDPSHFAAACDVFLEQTKVESSAGLAFRFDSSDSYLRFRLQTKGFDVIAVLERVTDEFVEVLARKEISTMLRGFTLRAVNTPDSLRCFVGREMLFEVNMEAQSKCTQIGLYNAAGNANLFDNFEIAARP
ncbi:MAG: FAD-dependent oxidoreductase [bacterium]